MASRAFQQFELPNGTTLKNRIGKAAMEERMADVTKHSQPSQSLVQLYKTWGEGGAGLILSGHVMIDPLSMASPGDILLAEDAGQFDEKLWRDWMRETQANGAQLWLQLNHPGRQIMKGSGLPTYAPSAVPMKLGAASRMFTIPLEMSEEHIRDVIRRFAWSARKAEELGASGVEIHAAHGYLVSQFLSPLTNQRTDQWGGPLENRSRLLFEVIRAIRAAVSDKFGVGVKINTADFQRGGFAPDEFVKVVEWLNGSQLDLLELSGGSYESPVMTTGKTGGNASSRSSTAQREAYFLEAARAIMPIGKMPIMVTGGIRRKAVLDDVLGSCDRFIAGIGSAMGYIPDLPNRWLKGDDPAPRGAKAWFLPRPLRAAAAIATVQYNMHAYGNLSRAWIGVWPVIALISAFLVELPQMKIYKQWIAQHDGFLREKEKAR